MQNENMTVTVEQDDEVQGYTMSQGTTALGAVFSFIGGGPIGLMSFAGAAIADQNNGYVARAASTALKNVGHSPA